jgi:hypothetical protein
LSIARSGFFALFPPLLLMLISWYEICDAGSGKGEYAVHICEIDPNINIIFVTVPNIQQVISFEGRDWQ